jgi:Skp family chaperone for outer membrane proteins
MTKHKTGFAGRGVLLGGLLLALCAAVEALQVTGQVLYGSVQNAQHGATVDILKVYAANPIYMRMKADGLSETDGGRGSKLFADAQACTNKALVKVARAEKVDVITVPGGMAGGAEPIRDLTAAVVDQLPLYFVEGRVLTGTAVDARVVVQLDSTTLLAAIPAWRESQALTENDANWHFLRKQAQDAFEKAVKKVARDGGYDAVVEKGGVTCRLGPVADVTQTAVAALGS